MPMAGAGADDVLVRTIGTDCDADGLRSWRFFEEERPAPPGGPRGPSLPPEGQVMTAPKSTVGRRWQAGFFLTPPRTSRFTPVPSLTIRLTVSTQNSIADQVMGVGGDGRRWADRCASAVPHIRGMVQAEARRALLYYGAATANEQSTVKASLGHRLPRPPAHRQPKAEAPEYSVSTACLS
jgi:hypothetical protein